MVTEAAFLTRSRRVALGSLVKELNRRVKTGKKWKEGQLQNFLDALAQQSPARESDWENVYERGRRA
jgi:hypothetical protein